MILVPSGISGTVVENLLECSVLFQDLHYGVGMQSHIVWTFVFQKQEVRPPALFFLKIKLQFSCLRFHVLCLWGGECYLNCYRNHMESVHYFG